MCYQVDVISLEDNFQAIITIGESKFIGLPRHRSRSKKKVSMIAGVIAANVTTQKATASMKSML